MPPPLRPPLLLTFAIPAMCSNQLQRRLSAMSALSPFGIFAGYVLPDPAQAQPVNQSGEIEKVNQGRSCGTSKSTNSGFILLINLEWP